MARRDVWEFVVDTVRQRPLTGYGFGSFWDDPDNVANQYDRIGRLGLFAHSTFFEALLFLGAVGLTLLIVVVATSVGRVRGTAIGNRELAMAWWTATAMFAFAENVAETHDLLPLDLLGSTRCTRLRRPPPYDRRRYPASAN